MQVAKIENSVIVEVLDTSRPELFPDFLPVPDHVHVGMDLRYFDDEYFPLPPDELIARGLIEPDPAPAEEPEPEPLTFEQKRAAVDNARRFAYADPLTGSDPLFAQYQRMLAMDEPGADDIKAQAIARYEVIRAEHPWPETDPV